MAEYLRHQGEFPDGCQIFSIISDNIPRDESNLRLDAGKVSLAACHGYKICLFSIIA